MDMKGFRHRGHQVVDRMADHMERVEGHPVRSRVTPGDIVRQLPRSPPTEGKPLEAVKEDVDRIVMPGTPR